MKKIYLIVLTAGLSFSMHAQHLTRTVTHNEPKKVSPAYTNKTSLWSNDFSVAADWESVNSPSNATWVVGTTAPEGPFSIGAIQSTTAANGYAKFDAFTTNLTGVTSYLKNVNPIDLTGNPAVTLSFQSYFKKFNFNTCSVGFSTNGTTFEWFTVHTNLGGNETSANPTTISIPAPASIGNSATVYVAFRFSGGIEYAWMVDDVEFIVTPAHDLNYNHANIHATYYSYSQVPLAQVSTVTSEVGVTNVGAQPMTNVTLTTTVSGAATDVATEVRASLAPGSVVDTIRTTFSPTVLGTYKITQALTTTETDLNASNNIQLVTDSFTVNNHIYAVDRGAPYYVMPNLATVYSGATFPRYEMGAAYDIYQAATLKGIDVMMANGTAMGTEIYGKLYKNNPSATSLADLWQATGDETEFLVIDNPNQLGTMLSLKFDEAVALEANATYMVTLVDQAKTGRLAYSGFTTANQVYLFISDGATSQFEGTDWRPVVRMNFDPALSVSNVDALAGVKIYPNPSTGIVNVSNDKGTKNTIVVTDVTGKVVSTNSSSSATTLDLSKNGTEIYFVEVANETGKFTQKVVIK